MISYVYAIAKISAPVVVLGTIMVATPDTPPIEVQHVSVQIEEKRLLELRPEPPKPVEQRVFKRNEQLSGEELKSILYEAGFRGQNLREAWGTAMKESTGRPMAHNKNSSTGDNSYGLFQINMIGSLGPARLEKYNLESNEDLFDPLVNAKIAYHMSNGGKNWSAWHGITERTKDWMKEFPDS